MKATIKYKIKETLVQLIHDNGEVVVKNGVLIEGEQLCTIYDLDEESFPFVCTLVHELKHMLSTQGLSTRVVNWEGGMDIEEEERLCSECGVPMQEGFYFESDAAQYCSEECLTKVITWEEYLEIHDGGYGDAYWTEWNDC